MTLDPLTDVQKKILLFLDYRRSESTKNVAKHLGAADRSTLRMLNELEYRYLVVLKVTDEVRVWSLTEPGKKAVKELKADPLEAATLPVRYIRS